MIKLKGVDSFRKRVGSYTSRPNFWLSLKRSAGWYVIDFARSRMLPPLGNPARIPAAGRGDWYYRILFDLNFDLQRVEVTDITRRTSTTY